jgi:hypothetical protein
MYFFTLVNMVDFNSPPPPPPQLPLTKARRKKEIKLLETKIAKNTLKIMLINIAENIVQNNQ